MTALVASIVGGAAVIVLAALTDSVIDEQRDPKVRGDAWWMGRLFCASFVFGVLALSAIKWLTVLR